MTSPLASVKAHPSSAQMAAAVRLAAAYLSRASVRARHGRVFTRRGQLTGRLATAGPQPPKTAHDAPTARCNNSIGIQVIGNGLQLDRDLSTAAFGGTASVVRPSAIVRQHPAWHSSGTSPLGNWR